MPPERTLFVVLLTLFAALLQPCVSLDDALQALTACASRSVAVHTPNSAHFNRLKRLSFRNNFATPLAIAEASNESQVSLLVACAARAHIRVCARSGGHSLIGHSLCKGLVIDLSAMRAVTLDAYSVATVQPGANMGELLWALHAQRRWIAAGVCPSVGFAGYVLGGGHGPYEGRLGLACDSMLSLRMVDRFGNVLYVSQTSRPQLFWAMCGAGGGQFGIVTEFRWKTVPSQPFDNAVVFRFRWPAERGGELLEKWQHYNEWGGDVWFRMEIYLASRDKAVFGYGACYNVYSVGDCMQRLNLAPFFTTEGRTTTYMSTVQSALDLHAFFGPLGGWGSYRANNIYQAMLQQRGKESGQANGRTYQSTFLRKGNGNAPSKQFWQQYVNFCQNPVGATSVNWVVCEMNLFNNAINIPKSNAFAFRTANVITHYIIGGGSIGHRSYMYNWMRTHLSTYTLGVYVNYPELEVADYAKSYWGGHTDWLKQVKNSYDPYYFFMNPQPIPTK